jgi:hypothetical protein
MCISAPEILTHIAEVLSSALGAPMFKPESSFFCAFLLFVCTVALPAAPERPVNNVPPVSYTKIPISFEANRGQTDAQVAFLGHRYFFTRDSVVIDLPVAQTGDKGSMARHDDHLAVRMSFAGRTHSEVIGEDKLVARSNYLIGSPANWHIDVPQYARVRYRHVYPGVDVVFYGNEHDLEYDVLLAPGTDLKQVRLRFEGAESIHTDRNGDLIVHTKAGELRQYSPRVYQCVRGRQHQVRGGYIVRSANEVGFQLGTFDRTKPVVIDPVLRWSTYLGGSGGSGDAALSIAVDSGGHAYVTGVTDSLDFPTTLGVIEPTDPAPGQRSAFVTKLAWNGQSVIYSTYFGGSNCSETFPTGIRVDGSGNAYITGSTDCTDLPVSRGAFQRTSKGNGEDFVAKLNATGTALVYSTYLGGSGTEKAGGIAIDSAGNAYITGETASADFPTTPGAFQSGKPASGSSPAAFVTKLSADGSSLVYSTYLGGPEQSSYPYITARGHRIAVDVSSNAYVMGTTNSTAFPVTAGAFQTSFGGFGSGYPSGDIFVTKLNSTGTGLVYSTYLGGSDNEDVFTDGGLTIDSAGNVYITGDSFSGDFPTTPGAFLSPASCGPVLTKLNPSGTSLVYSGHWAIGPCPDGESFATGIAVDGGGYAYVVGQTTAHWPNFPFVRAFQESIVDQTGTYNTFVIKMNPTGTAPAYSSLLGGNGYFDLGTAIALDSAGNAYVTGETNSADFPVTQGVFQRQKPGRSNGEVAFVAKLIPVCEAEPTDPSVTICSPGDGATLRSPAVVRTVTRDSSSPVVRSEVWVDFVKVYEIKLSALYAKIPLTVGTHRLTVQSLDHSGVFFKKTVYVNVVP